MGEIEPKPIKYYGFFSLVDIEPNTYKMEHPPISSILSTKDYKNISIFSKSSIFSYFSYCPYSKSSIFSLFSMYRIGYIPYFSHAIPWVNPRYYPI